MKKNKKSKIIYFLLTLIAILFILFITIIFIQWDLGGYFNKLNEKPKLFTIQDQCSAILNNILHTIPDKDNCRIRCVNQCSMREMKLNNFEFINSTVCYSCNCYCK